MLDLREVLSTIDSTSSGTGNSYYTKLCPRKALLDLELQDDGSFNIKVGSVEHKLLDLYYTGKLANEVLPLDDHADFKTDHVQEALRLFAGYTTFFPADEWTVVATERRLPRQLCIGQQDDELVYQDHPGDAAIFKEVFGVDYAVRPDAKVYLDERQAAQMQERQNLPVLPGFYLVDYKTHEQRSNNANLKYQLSTQFATYMMGEQAIFPQEEIQGMLVRDMVRHKKLTELENGLPRSFSTFLVPFPSEATQKMIRSYLVKKEQVIKSNFAEIGACVDYISGKVCSHYESGRCQRNN